MSKALVAPCAGSSCHQPHSSTCEPDMTAHLWWAETKTEAAIHWAMVWGNSSGEWCGVAWREKILKVACRECRYGCKNHSGAHHCRVPGWRILGHRWGIELPWAPKEGLGWEGVYLYIYICICICVWVYLCYRSLFFFLLVCFLLVYYSLMNSLDACYIWWAKLVITSTFPATSRNNSSVCWSEGLKACSEI